MQKRTQSTQYASTRWIKWITVVYTSLGLSGCKSNQDVIALDRSCSPKFTTTYKETICHIELITITPVPKNYTITNTFRAFHISVLEALQLSALAAFLQNLLDRSPIWHSDKEQNPTTSGNGNHTFQPKAHLLTGWDTMAHELIKSAQTFFLWLHIWTFVILG
jgi:hypothetical protein